MLFVTRRRQHRRWRRCVFFGNIADLGNIDGIQLECFNEINRNYIYPMDMVILTTSQGQGESKIAWKFINHKYLLKKVSKSNTHFIKLWCYLYFLKEYMCVKLKSSVNVFKFSIWKKNKFEAMLKKKNDHEVEYIQKFKESSFQVSLKILSSFSLVSFKFLSNIFQVSFKFSFQSFLFIIFS